MSERNFTPWHMAVCFADLGYYYAREVAARLGETVLDALDCWPDDDPEAQLIKSDLWQHTIEELQAATNVKKGEK